MKQPHENVLSLRRGQAVDGQGSERYNALIRRMEQFETLSDESRRLVTSCTEFKDFAPHTSIWREGEPVAPLWLASGWACRQKVLPDGRRQIINFILPGDTLGLYEPTDVTGYGSVVALTAVRAYVADDIKSELHAPEHQDLSRALDRERAAQEAILYDQIVRLGRRTAFERVYHLLEELNTRLTAVGLAQGNRFELPLTQEILADAVGLSIVHVNRTLQQMRRQGLLELRGGFVHVRQSADLEGVEASLAGQR